MDFGRKVGSKIDRYGSTFAERSAAIKAASKVASDVLKEKQEQRVTDKEEKSFLSRPAAGSKFGSSFKKK